MVDDEFFTGLIMIYCVWFVMPTCDIPIATTAPPTISVDMSLIHGTTDPMPPFRRFSWDPHPYSVLPFLLEVYVIHDIYCRTYPRRRLASLDTSWPSRRIATFTGLCGCHRHNSRFHGTMDIGLILRSQGPEDTFSWDLLGSTFLLCIFFEVEIMLDILLPYIMPTARLSSPCDG